MKTYISIFLSCFILILAACQKSVIEPITEPELLTYDIDLEINPAYFAESQEDSISVRGRLNLERGLMICDPFYMAGEFHNYYCNQELSSDSLMVLASILYEIELNNLEISTVEIQFLYAEARANLIADSDSTFVYHDYIHLYNQMKNNAWDSKIFTETYNCNQASINLPDNQIPWGEVNMGTLNSDSFYFDWENFTIEECTYDIQHQSINFSANFDVSLKVMSCGYAEFYHLNNASFNAVINPVR